MGNCIWSYCLACECENYNCCEHFIDKDSESAIEIATIHQENVDAAMIEVNRKIVDKFEKYKFSGRV